MDKQHPPDVEHLIHRKDNQWEDTVGIQDILGNYKALHNIESKEDRKKKDILPKKQKR